MRGLLAIFAVVLALAVPATSRADSYQDAISPFAADSYGDTEAAVEGLAASGNPLASDVIQALAAGRLVVRGSDKGVFVRDATGALRDARTGAPASTEPGDLKAVR